MNGGILVTGGTGLAGRHVLAALNQRGWPVLPIARSPANGWHVADITDDRSMSSLPSFEVAIHCAGLTPRRSRLTWTDFERLNVRATERIAQLALDRGASGIVLVSTLGRATRRAQTREGRLYVVSKHLAERALRRVARGRMRVWIVRAASMYGEGDRGSMARLIRSVASGRFVLPGGGRQRKCVLYAGTLGQIVAAELAQGAVPAVTESAYDLQIPTLAEIVAIVERHTGRRAVRVPAPATLVDGIIAAGLRLPLARPRELAMGARIALRDVPCRGPNVVARHPDLAVPLAEALGREVVWLRGA